MSKFDLATEKENVLSSSAKVRKLIGKIVDDGSFVEIGAFSFSSCELLGGNAAEGVITGYGTVDGIPCYLYAQNGEVLGGGFSKAHAEKIANLYKKAGTTGTPVIGILDSLGARVGEGVGCLEGYAKLLSCVSGFSGVAPQVCVVAGNACGIISSVAALCDVTFALNNACVSTLSPSVMSGKENSHVAGEKLIGADHALQSGIATKVVSEDELKDNVLKFLEMTVVDGDGEISDENGNDAIASGVNGLDLIKLVADNGDYFEMYEGYGKNAVTAFIKLGGFKVGAVATCGKLSVKELKKISRFEQLLESLGLPLISLVDSDGLDSSLKEEDNGLIADYAKLIYLLNNTSNVKLSVACGNATGAAYVALCSGNSGFDNVVAWDSAKVSPLSTDTAVEVYFADVLKKYENKENIRKELSEKYESENANAIIAAREGYIDNVIEPEFTRNYLISALSMLIYKDTDSAVYGNMPL